MMKRVLILGAGGTVGAAICKQLACDENLQIVGTYFSAKQVSSLPMIHFSVEFPDDICAILEQVRPDIVISSLSGDFDKQLLVHEKTAKYLANSRGKIIYVSTANVYDGSCQRPHYETDPPLSDSDYGKFKIQCEDLLKSLMDSRAVLLRIPFVWGRNSPRIRAVKAGCEAGKLEVYSDFSSNHVSDVQIAQVVQWIISEDKDGIFHVGTSDVVNYSQFIEHLIAAMGMRQPEFVTQKVPAVMAVLSERQDIPDTLQWNSQRLIQYLCE